MATNIPPHNLTEVKRQRYLIQNPNARLKTLMVFCRGRTSRAGGFIYGRDGVARHTRRGAEQSLCAPRGD